MVAVVQHTSILCGEMELSVTKTITDCISFHKMPTMQPTSKVSEETFLPLHGCGRSRVTCAGEQNKSRYAHCTESVQCIV